VGVASPALAREHVLNRPRLNDGDPPVFLDATRLGFPLFDRRSRLSDARRFFPDLEACAALESFVAAEGGAAFFARDNWRATLAPRLRTVHGAWESPAARLATIEHELVAARAMLEARLATSVRHLCLPWGITSADTRRLIEQLGFETAVANRLPGMYAVREGDDPFYLKRLPHRHIFALPGRGRRALRTLA
jgi:hypothetical protein